MNRVRVGAWYEEHSVGDGPIWKARPVLMGALSALRDGEGVTLVIASRGSLDVGEEGVIEAFAQRQRGRVVSADGSTARAAALRLASGLGTYENVVRSTRARAERRRQQAEGRVPFGCVPYGYRLTADGKRIVRDAGEQRALAVVARMRAGGRLLREIVAELGRLGLRSRRGNRIGTTRVFEILRDIEKEPRHEEHRQVLRQGARSGRG